MTAMPPDLRKFQAESLEAAAKRERELGQRLLVEYLENAERYEEMARKLRETNARDRVHLSCQG